MALLPYILNEPLGSISSLLVDSPHSGRIYPADFVYQCPLNLLRQAEDSFVDELVSGCIDAGISLITAEFPRSMIDVNRAEDDIDPAVMQGEWLAALNPEGMTRSGFGLVRRLCKNGIPLYQSPLSTTEVKRRIETYYRPYHHCLQQQVARRLQQFGTCYLIDMHSMPDAVDNGVARPDFILGDRGGASCDPLFTKQVQSLLENMGYSIALNAPYKGREIVRRYGQEGQGAHALQVEINRKLYINEQNIEKNTGFDLLRANLTKFFHEIEKIITLNADERLAAE